MTILIYTDRGKDLYKSFDYLIKGIQEYIDEEKWKAEYSHSRVLIKSKTNSKELLITGRCIDPNKVKGLNPDCFYIISSSPEVEEYLKSRGATPLYRIAFVKAVVLSFIKEE